MNSVFELSLSVLWTYAGGGCWRLVRMTEVAR